MSSLERTSIFVENQLPGFIVGNPEYTLFVQFLQKYYEYLELPGNPVYELRRAEENYDVDLARKTLLRYFKDKILPSFPEETELSTERIIKASRDFYAKKGTPDSFKFLFRILYGQEVDLFLPKTNILRASDGKWALPQAIRISLSDNSIKLPSTVAVVAAQPSSILYGANVLQTGVVANSYIRISNERRKIVTVNYSSNTFNVDLQFANTPASLNSGTIYMAGNAIYRLIENDNASFDFSLLNKKLAIGANSRTQCIIENAYKTYDTDTGEEIAELYVSNVNRDFEAGENLEVEYTDTNGVVKTFSSRITALVSNVLLKRDRFNNSFGGRRYSVGDPVVFEGGLDKDIDKSRKAIAVVKDVTTGSIDVVSLNKPGYYFRTNTNGGLIQIQSTTGVGANLLIANIWTDGGYTNSNSFSFATDAIAYKKDILLNDDDYEFDNVTNIIGLTTGPGNSTTTVNLNTATYIASTVNDYYKSFVLTIIAGTGVGETSNILSYNGTTKIATLYSPLATTPDATSNVKITANAYTEIGRSLSYDTFTLGKIQRLDLVDVGSAFISLPTFEAISTFETDYSLDAGFQYVVSGFADGFYGYDPDSLPYPSIKLASSNNQFSLANGFYTGTRVFMDTGDTAHYVDVVDYVVTNPATSANVKTLFLSRKFENNITPLNINRFLMFIDYRANVRNTGQIGAVEIINGGTGYNANDRVNFIGTGYGAYGEVVVDGGGKITSVVMNNRGEGYYGPITAVVNTSNGGITSGTSSNLAVWGLSDGENISATTTPFGKIKTFDILNRGFGYLTTPNVSLKVLDIFAGNTGSLSLATGDRVWQGNVSTNANATFTAIVDDFYNIPDSPNGIVRLYNYNGVLANTIIYANTSAGNVSFNVTPNIGTYSFLGKYAAVERQYPYYYGDGLAKARAEFLNGLIKYQGYYLSTDGFPSADQRLQDNDYYHNFSYEIQSEKSLDEYRTTVYEVIHPAGTQLLSKFLIKDTLDETPIFTSNICSSNSITTGITTSFSTTTITGTGSAYLAATANVGDIVVINSDDNEYRRDVRTIATVSPSITVDYSVGRFGDGLMKLTNGSPVANLVANSYPYVNTLQVGDVLNLYTLSNGVYTVTVTEVGLKNNVTVSTPFPFDTQNLVYRINPTYTNVPYRLIKIIG